MRKTLISLCAATVVGVTYALAYWGLSALFGFPSFLRPHHLAEYLPFVGLIFGLGYFFGRNSAEDF